MTDEEADYISLRAEQLWVLIDMIGEEPSTEPDDPDVPTLSRDAANLLALAGYQFSEDDLSLAVECINIARPFRAQQWRGLEWLGDAMFGPGVSPACGGFTHRSGLADPGTQFIAVPRSEVVKLARWVLGWDYPIEPVVPVSEECARYAEAVEPDPEEPEPENDAGEEPDDALTYADLLAYDRATLKEVNKVNELGIKVLDSMSDDDLRAAIAEALGLSPDD